jgi:hypothetical protein
MAEMDRQASKQVGYDSATKTHQDSMTLISIYKPEAIQYTPYYSTIWDMFEEMTYRHPGYVKHPRIYKHSNRMTMFFGLPDQNMWEDCGDPLDIFRANKIFAEILKSSNAGTLLPGDEWLRESRINASQPPGSTTKSTTNGQGQAPVPDKIFVDGEKVTEFLRIARRRYKPFRSWHNVNSYTDIISNDIEATADGWYTEVEIQYNHHHNSLPSRADIKNPNGSIDWGEDNRLVRKANVELSPQFTRQVSYQFPNCRGKAMASNYGRSILAKQAKDMYKGSLTILGNPHIKPYDVCIINDTYNNIYGPIEVEEVHHILSPETGYITQIYPDTLVVEDDVNPYIILNGIHSSIYTRTEYYATQAILASPSWGSSSNYTTQGKQYYDEYSRVISKYQADIGLIESEMNAGGKVINTLAKTSSLAGLILGGLVGANTFGGLGGLASAGVGAAYSYFYASAKLTSIMYNYIGNGRAYLMVPLIREGMPFVSGINVGYAGGLYKSPMQMIRSYWLDGGIGNSIEMADTIMKEANTRSRYGEGMDNIFLNAQFTADNFAFGISKVFEDIGGAAVNSRLFPQDKLTYRKY